MEASRQPKQLPCGHTFCMCCLERIQQHSTSVCCPECRAQHNLSGGVRSLPVNISIQRLLDHTSTKGQSSKKETTEEPWFQSTDREHSEKFLTKFVDLSLNFNPFEDFPDSEYETILDPDLRLAMEISLREAEEREEQKNKTKKSAQSYGFFDNKEMCYDEKTSKTLDPGPTYHKSTTRDKRWDEWAEAVASIGAAGAAIYSPENGAIWGEAGEFIVDGGTLIDFDRKTRGGGGSIPKINGRKIFYLQQAPYNPPIELFGAQGGASFVTLRGPCSTRIAAFFMGRPEPYLDAMDRLVKSV